MDSRATHRDCIGIDAFDELIRDNVIISKGKNRHPYADVLHEWIEGAELQAYNEITDEWEDVIKTNRAWEARFRLKPSMNTQIQVGDTGTNPPPQTKLERK